MAFQHIVTVRFNEVDRAGIAFFGRVYEYCHAVFEELLVAMGNSISNVFDNGKWGMPLVHSHADYKRPMRLGEELTIEVTVPNVGDTSITFDYRVLGPEGDLRCTCQLVHVIVDLATFKPREVPEDLLEAVRHFDLIPRPDASGDTA